MPLNTMVPTDEQLIKRYLAGETDTFNLLVRKWETRIFNFALRYCGSREDAQDLSQEVFTSVFQRLQGLRDRGSFAPWLYKIALNCCRMKYRAAKGRKDLALDAPEMRSFLEREAGISFSKGLGNPEENVGHMEKRRFLIKALARISGEQRLVILLKEYEGLKFHEIAEILDCPLSTVKSRLYLGFRALRENLEKYGLGNYT